MKALRYSPLFSFLNSTQSGEIYSNVWIVETCDKDGMKLTWNTSTVTILPE